MKHYGAMRFVAGVMQLIGWIVVLLGAFALVAAFGGANVSAPYASAGIGAVAVIIGGGIILTGLFTVAAGQMIDAIADMATNSWRLREIAENSRQTVGFFEHITNARAPAVNVSA